MLIDELARYFSGEGRYSNLGLRNLAKNYTWPKKGTFPSYSQIFDFELGDGTNFDKNIRLKMLSPSIWAQADKYQLSNWIVRDWGGIRGNKAVTLINYVDEITRGNFPVQLKGVASYSKILSFMDPTKFAIYDARVAISLNAIQLLGGLREGEMFCYLPGRNTVLDKFRKDPSTHAASLVALGWAQIEPDRCYQRYLEVLDMVRKRLDGPELYELEMSLFADAESLSEMYLGMHTTCEV